MDEAREDVSTARWSRGWRDSGGDETSSLLGRGGASGHARVPRAGKSGLTLGSVGGTRGRRSRRGEGGEGGRTQLVEL